MPASPCINLCRMDEASGLCRGCFRTLDEIATWASSDDSRRARILAAVARRRQEATAAANPPPADQPH